jgi:hypothetical protein
MSKKHALLMIALIFPLITSAEYIVSIKIHDQINFVKSPSEVEEPEPTEPTEPTEPPETGFPFSQYKGIGSIDTADGSGFLESTTIENPMYRGVLFRSFGNHSIWLKGNQKELLANTSAITMTINGDTYPCIIYDSGYSVSTKETAFHCRINGFVGTKYSVGQNFNVAFR